MFPVISGNNRQQLEQVLRLNRFQELKKSILAAYDVGKSWDEHPFIALWVLADGRWAIEVDISMNRTGMEALTVQVKRLSPHAQVRNLGTFLEDPTWV